jgi:hypothetical protein
MIFNIITNEGDLGTINCNGNASDFYSGSACSNLDMNTNYPD